MSGGTVVKYDPIIISPESTVVSEFINDINTETAYQSEAELEQEFIKILTNQAYEYLPITTEAQLIANLRSQLERLNNVKFSDKEWSSFFFEKISGVNEGVVEKTIRIQEDPVQILTRDDGSFKNITLLDKNNIHNNALQVINQYEVNTSSGARRTNRYDVTILVNGLPLVHIELKRRGVDVREAFNQIDRYHRDSFWAGSGLFDYVQLFVISNGTLTKYYSNTTRNQHVSAQMASGRNKTTSNSFEFTSWWADSNNRPIRDLISFTKTFFAKHTILNILTRYCVLTSDRLLLVMRPYQIVATERIIQKIDCSSNSNKLGTVAAGGYVWHTTGSGKTLTSFKAAQLASRVPGVDKVIFVVDRKDLDYQTMREYDRFEKGAANSNRSTAVLKKQLEDSDSRIIITTIQKLSKFIGMNKDHPIYGGHVVIIFDECHRSQFGDMHTAITKAFKRYNIFGFTGTPIFSINASSNSNHNLRTTPQAFGCYLHGDPSKCADIEHQMSIHTYSIVDAISDKNVLPLRIDYVNTIKASDKVLDKKVFKIDTEHAMLAPERISGIVRYTLEHFSQKTKRMYSYDYSIVSNVKEVVSSSNKTPSISRTNKVKGFNALFATASIDAAKKYYSEFKRQQSNLADADRLNIAVIFSYAANEEALDGYIDGEGFNTDNLEKSSRDFLDAAIDDYNKMFNTNYDTSSEKFQNYYKDISLRLRNCELDLLIVVNMFLTGFDATTLNTLFIDKHLMNHGLIQAYSRVNRVLNSVKTFGNIVSFRNLEQETNEAIALFGNKNARGIVIMKPYAEYYANYIVKVNELLKLFPIHDPIIGQKARSSFVNLFGSILRLRNILTSFDDFIGNDILSPRQLQDYRSIYLDIHSEFKNRDSGDREPIVGDVVFEIELIKQAEINVDYILMLISKWADGTGVGSNKTAPPIKDITRAIDSSTTLRNKKDLIMSFINSVTASDSIDEEWRAHIDAQRDLEINKIIKEYSLKPKETRDFITRALREGGVPNMGTDIVNILPAASRFASHGGHSDKKRQVLARMEEFFDKFYGVVVV